MVWEQWCPHLTLYSWTTPFCSSSGGGCQATRMAVPLVSLLVMVTPRGAPLGAAMMDKKNIQIKLMLANISFHWPPSFLAIESDGPPCLKIQVCHFLFLVMTAEAWPNIDGGTFREHFFFPCCEFLSGNEPVLFSTPQWNRFKSPCRVFDYWSQDQVHFHSAVCVCVCVWFLWK